MKKKLTYVSVNYFDALLSQNNEIWTRQCIEFILLISVVRMNPAYYFLSDNNVKSIGSIEAQ